jgi:LPXTG-motif cell wall-anchored protein
MFVFLNVFSMQIVSATGNDLGSLTINYIDDGIRIENNEAIQKSTPIKDAEFSISLVVYEDNGIFKWSDNIKDNIEYNPEVILDKDLFQDVAKELIDVVPVMQTQISDKNGQCVFTNLERGIYLVWESNKEGLAEKYHDAVPFFIEVPNKSVEPHDFNVVAYPKAELITEKMISITGTKSWRGNDIVGVEKPSSEIDSDKIKVYRPETITLRLYANGIEVAQTTTNAKQNWCFAFDDVNALDENGDEVTFIIKEDFVEGYIFSQDAPIVGENTIIINVTNTVDNDSPQTGDESKIVLWIILGVSSLIGMLVVLYDSKKKK